MDPAAGPEEDVNNLSPMHDPLVLPHMYADGDMEGLFEKAIAPREPDCAPSGACICSRPDCEICFPPPAPEFGPPIVDSEAWLAVQSERQCLRRQSMRCTLLGGEPPI